MNAVPAVREAPDIEGLRKFARATDRSDPPTFTGRVEEIGETRRRVLDCVDDWRAGERSTWKGRTTLIQGAPGAGKTALLEHLADTLPREIEGLQVCRVGPKEAGRPADWRPRLAEALFEGAGDRMLKTRSVEGEVDVKVAKGRAGTTGPWLNWGEVVAAAKRAPRAEPEETKTESGSREGESGSPSAFARVKNAGSNIAGETADAFAGLGPVRPVLLLIDEAQEVEDDKETFSFLCETLHESTYGLPVFPIYGGLAWTSEKLGDLGISRKSLGYVRTLDPLSGDECREAVRGFFAKFRVRGSAQIERRWADAIAAECDGWPQHLHTHLQALADELSRPGADVGGDMDALERSGGAPAVAEDARRRREAYYEERLRSGRLKDVPNLAALGAALVADIARLAGGPHAHLQKSDLGALLERASEDSTRPRLQLPAGATGAEFAEAMVRGGLLHRGAKGALSVPIPSFAAYLRCEYAAEASVPKYEDYLRLGREFVSGFEPPAEAAPENSEEAER